MPLRKVDSGVYVTEEGQFVISLAKSGRRAFLVPDTAAEWYVTTYGRIRALTAVLLALACAGAALNLFSPIWVLSAVVIPSFCVRWLRNHVAENFPPVTDSALMANIAERNEGLEPVWAPVFSLTILVLLEWSGRHPVESGWIRTVVTCATLLAASLQLVVNRRARDAYEYDRPSSAVTR